jgi:hypothetical protein
MAEAAQAGGLLQRAADGGRNHLAPEHHPTDHPPWSGPSCVAHVNLAKIRCNTNWFDAFWERPDDNAFYLTKYPI